MRARREPVPDSDWTVALRFSRSTALCSPNASRADSRQNCVPEAAPQHGRAYTTARLDTTAHRSAQVV